MAKGGGGRIQAYEGGENNCATGGTASKSGLERGGELVGGVISMIQAVIRINYNGPRFKYRSLVWAVSWGDFKAPDDIRPLAVAF